MENLTVSGLRSRSRSKTPFLRSSCDRETCTEGGDHIHHKSGRKTPVRRNTPVKQLNNPTSKQSEPIIEEDEPSSSHRTRQSTRLSEKVKTSDYSSEESLDPVKRVQDEVVQNEINSRYERISSTRRRYGTLEDVTLSPIHVTSPNVTADRSRRFGSPAYSACSTDSSFAEQALADTSLLLDREPTVEHLPYRLYKMAGEYWNKYPKTDYTYSPLSKDRVELAPGQIAVPNMSRRSLSQFRIQGPNTSADEVDRLTAANAWAAGGARKRFNNIDSSDDETYFRGNGRVATAEQRWWLTTIITSIITTITTTITSARDSLASGYRRLVGPAHRYPYTERRPQEAGITLSRTASAVAAPFYWFYMMIKTIITTTVTTITETISPTQVPETRKRVKHSYQEKIAEQPKRRWWPWMLLLLLPAVVYGSHFTYQNMDQFAMPNFTDFQLNLSDFSAIELPKITLPSLPNITLAELNILPSIKLPDINITLPDISENLPEVTKTYRVYKEIMQNRAADASDYMKVVAESCFEEMRRFWHGILG